MKNATNKMMKEYIAEATIFITHTDLDGFGCEFIYNECVDNDNIIRTNPGSNLIKALEDASNDIKKYDNSDNGDIIVITDLNLIKGAIDVIKENSDVKYIWIDHHTIDDEVKAILDKGIPNLFYKITSVFDDEMCCATKLLFNILFEGDVAYNAYKNLIEYINLYDTYQFKTDNNENHFFSFSNIRHNNLKIHFSEMLNYIYHSPLRNSFFDEFSNGIHTNISNGGIYKNHHLESILYNHEIYSDYIFSNLEDDRRYVENKMEDLIIRSITIDDVSYNVGVVFAESCINQVGSKICEDPNIDFAVIFGSKAISLRASKPEINCAEFAKKFNPAGGGHKGAAGAAITSELRKDLIKIIFDSGNIRCYY